MTEGRGKTLSILIVVTHLLGVGHLARAATLARALARSGHRVTLVSGGRASPLIRTEGVAFQQLPPVHCVGTDFRTLYGDDALPVGDRLLAERSLILLGALARTRPDVVVTELYPFGRRQLSGEFSLLVDAALALRPRPAILTSVRDILNPPSRPERVAETTERLAAFDAVLVHGDAAAARLNLSWPVDRSLERRLIYTGYLARESDAADAGPEPRVAPDAEAAGEGRILVTGGGSASGLPLYRAALAAARLDTRPGARWHLLVGHGVPEDEFAALRNERGPALVERARADFPALVGRADAVVSQAGYNTMIDLARAGARAVLVPFDEGNEREQSLRAEVWAGLGLATVVPARDLTGERLVEAVREALARPRPSSVPVSCEGDQASVAAIATCADGAAALEAARNRLALALDDVTARGRRLTLWWRDDDAVAPTEALERLIDLTRRLGAPLGLAVIPDKATEALARRVSREPHLRVLQHGCSHANRAPPGSRKIELGGTDLPMLVEDLRRGQRRFASLFQDRALPVLVPPWNRIDPTLVPLLPELGYAGISTFKRRAAEVAAPGLVQVNTHWDPENWKGGGLADPVMLLDALAAHAREVAAGRADPGEPFGILTHHLVHDAWTWRFLAEVLALLVGRGRAVFADPLDLFG